MTRAAILTVFLNAVSACAAQAQSRLDCPRPVRETRHRSAPKMYLELGAGIARPVLYRNGAGSAGEKYSYTARSTPFAAATGFLMLGEKLEAFAGLNIYQSWQGLRFKYSDNIGELELNSFAGSLTTSLPVGLRYHASPRFWLSAGLYAAYVSHVGKSAEDAAGSHSFYTFRSEARNSFNFGVRLGADVQLIKRFALMLALSADALESTPSTGTADFSPRRGPVYQGAMQPYLIHAAAGISYKLGYRSEE